MASAFEKWAEGKFSITRCHGNTGDYVQDRTRTASEAWNAALEAAAEKIDSRIRRDGMVGRLDQEAKEIVELVHALKEQR